MIVIANVIIIVIVNVIIIVIIIVIVIIIIIVVIIIIIIVIVIIIIILIIIIVVTLSPFLKKMNVGITSTSSTSAIVYKMTQTIIFLNTSRTAFIYLDVGLRVWYFGINYAFNHVQSS